MSSTNSPDNNKGNNSFSRRDKNGRLVFVGDKVAAPYFGKIKTMYEGKVLYIDEEECKCGVLYDNKSYDPHVNFRTVERVPTPDYWERTYGRYKIDIASPAPSHPHHFEEYLRTHAKQDHAKRAHSEESSDQDMQLRSKKNRKIGTIGSAVTFDEGNEDEKKTSVNHSNNDLTANNPH